MNINEQVAEELSIKSGQVNSVLNLFNEGATIPFIARYRKEKTGGLDEDELRKIEDRLSYLSMLEDRKETVLKSIEEQGRLTADLKTKIIAAVKLQQVEDIYLPFRPKRKTRGTTAKAKGLEPLAVFMLENPNFIGDFSTKVAEFINKEKGAADEDEALGGAKDIIAEMISESAEVRSGVREFLLEHAALVSSAVTRKDSKAASHKKDVYEIYHNFTAPITKLKPYQVLAINRGEKEKFLKVVLSFDKPKILDEIFDAYFENDDSVFNDIFREIVDDSFIRLIYPSLEREVRKQLTEEADVHAVEVFASNLRQLLLQSPISGKVIMGIDPGFISGSKVAIIDQTGKYLEGKTIFPHPPQSRKAEAKNILSGFINKYGAELIAIGNGTASRETEILIAELINENNLDCSYIIVNEAGASVYSASPVAKQEFPDLEASQRGNISIARRVLDPLAELVKIDPKSIGVGLYQHDVDRKLITKKLDDVVISCVNYVGVDLNTASASLLTYVSGLNKSAANSIVNYRDVNGKFLERKQLLKVPGVGEKLFEQAAGFLKIPGGANPLDNTFIHPESYPAAESLLNLCSISTAEIKEKGDAIDVLVKSNGIEKLAGRVNVGEPTLIDIIENLKKPGRDPREDMPKPILRTDVLKISDLQEGMKLKGTVRNIVDFGAFVDIGVKQDGLLHISQIADKFIKHPLEILNVGDIIEVSVKELNVEKGRISLTMLA